MRVELSGLHAELGATMVYVTHDQIEAMTMASRIVVLNKGLIEQVGSPLELYRNPDNLFVAGFLGAPRMNFLNVTADDSVRSLRPRLSAWPFAADESNWPMPSTFQRAQPRHSACGRKTSTVVTDGSEIPGTPSNGRVRLVEHLGRETILYVDAGSLRTVASESGTGNITVQLSYVAPFKTDQSVALKLDPGELYLFWPKAAARSAPARQSSNDRNQSTVSDNKSSAAFSRVESGQDRSLSRWHAPLSRTTSTRADWERDAERMAAAGFNVVGMAEFAWHILEPELGSFDFDLFDRVIAILGAAWDRHDHVHADSDAAAVVDGSASGNSCASTARAVR